MKNTLKVNNNENLIRNTFDFLSVKDLSLASQVSHLFRKSSTFFNSYWREHTKKLFCSNIEHYNLLPNNKDVKIEDFKDEMIDWKAFLKLGFEIKNGWQAITFSNDEMTQEIMLIQNELYGTLKEYYSLPKLRKENLYVESDINTILQTYLYDFVYDQQDLYDHYDRYLKDYNDRLLDMNAETLEVKTPGIPFSSCLINFDEQIYIFENEVDRLVLAKFRWYHYDEELVINSDLDISLNKKFTSLLMMEEADCFKYLPLNLSSWIVNDAKRKHQDNGVLLFFTSLIYSLTYFCKLNYKLILNCSVDDSVFLNEYIKRHKSYTDAAIYLNDYLENFNVLVNYLYENCFKNYPDFPKFSVFRLMMNIWYREVLCPLEDNYSLLSNKSVKLFKKYMINEINKTFENNNIKLKLKLKDTPLKETFNEDVDVNFSLDTFHNNIFSEVQIGRKSLTHNIMINTNSTSSSVSTHSQSTQHSTQTSFTQPFAVNPNKDKMVVVGEEIGSFEFQTEYFIEQTLTGLMDFSLNEFSVYYINSSKMHSNKYYEAIENKIVNFIDDLTRNFKKSKIELLHHFKESDFLRSRLANRTKLRIITIICNNMIKASSEDMYMLFEDFMQKNANLTLIEAQSYLKLHGDLPDLIYERVYDQLYATVSKRNLDDAFSKYLCLNFIRDASKNKAHPIHLLEESTEWLKSEESGQMGVDELIDNENARRHISLKREHEEKLFNFTSNLTWDFIVSTYQNEVKPKMKGNKMLDFSGTSNLDYMESNNNEVDNNNSMDIDILSLGKR